MSHRAMLPFFLVIALISQLYGEMIMAGGTDTILKLHPTGGTTITFDMTGAAAESSGGYVVDAKSIRFNEEKRMEIAYSEGANVDGGEAISYHGPLISVTFPCIVYGTTPADRISKANALINAVTNEKGGTLEFKPDGLGAGVRSTYYRYVQSRPPKPMERWDKGQQGSGLYRMMLEVELMTQPYPISDPGNPVVALGVTTVYNQDDGVAGHVTVPAANVKGTVGALTQLRIRNMVSGAWAAIGKLWYARRADPGGNFNPILEGGTPDTDSSIWWSTVSDTTRRSNNFQRFAPPAAANNLWASLSYTISNPTDHEGKMAVAVVCRSLAEGTGDWDLKAALQVADVVVETGIKNVANVGTWTVLILGELDIPPTPTSADESYAPKLYIYLCRTTGDEANAIDIDFVKLLYVDEYPQQVNVSDGFTNSYKLLLENFDQELCHVVDQSTLAFEKTAEPLCPLLQLEPGVDNRIDFIWQRLIEQALDDDFEQYEAWRWAPVADCEADENWMAWNGTISNDTTYYVEGDQAIRCTEADVIHYSRAYLDFPSPKDLTQEGRFGNDDYVYFVYYLSRDAIQVEFRFYTTDWDTDYFSSGALPIGAGFHFAGVKKSDFATNGSPDWTNIKGIAMIAFFPAGPQAYVTFDDFRLVKADPDDATKGNDTGAVWDFMRDVWHIEEQDPSDKTLGCLDITADLEQVALIHEEPPANIKYLAKVRAKRDDGEVGLVFRCEDGTSGSEDMAAFFVDTTNDQLELRKWIAGTSYNIVTPVSQTTAPDTDYWLGVWILDDSTIRCYFGTSKAAIWDDETESFVASARKFNVTAAVFGSGGALAGGQCGLFSMGTLGRFDSVELYAAGDGHVPGDTIQIYLPVIYRTIYPFSE